MRRKPERIVKAARPRAVLSAILLTSLLCGSWPLTAAEIVATHLVYEKLVKMKKTEALLFLPFLDQGKRSDSAERAHEVDCIALADGKKGSLPVKGTFRLRLLGDSGNASSTWRSKALSAPVTDLGGASFESTAILGLVEDAEVANARIDMFEIEFDGGRGKKVRTLTVDCIHREAE